MAKHLKSITSDEIDQVVSTLDPAVSLFKYFSNNQIKANPHNYHSLINKDSRKKNNHWWKHWSENKCENYCKSNQL